MRALIIEDDAEAAGYVAKGLGDAEGMAELPPDILAAVGAP